MAKNRTYQHKAGFWFGGEDYEAEAEVTVGSDVEVGDVSVYGADGYVMNPPQIMLNVAERRILESIGE